MTAMGKEKKVEEKWKDVADGIMVHDWKLNFIDSCDPLFYNHDDVMGLIKEEIILKKWMFYLDK